MMTKKRLVCECFFCGKIKAEILAIESFGIG